MKKDQSQVRPCDDEGIKSKPAQERIGGESPVIKVEVPISGGAPGSSSQEDFETIKKRMARASIQKWTQLIMDSVEPNEWTLGVDDISDMTPSVARLMAQLNKKFVIIAATQEVKKQHEKYFWKFEKIPVPNLPKPDAQKLIRQCTAGVDAEDAQLLETTLWTKSHGNPRAILEMADRLQKEPSATRQSVRDLSHTGARPKIDMTWAIILLVIPLIAARFIARGLGDIEIYMLAGIGSALAMGLRFFLYRLRR